MMKKLTHKVEAQSTKGLYDRFKRACKKKGISMAAAIREFMKDYSN